MDLQTIVFVDIVRTEDGDPFAEFRNLQGHPVCLDDSMLRARIAALREVGKPWSSEWRALKAMRGDNYAASWLRQGLQARCRVWVYLGLWLGIYLATAVGLVASLFGSI